ncbi:MAG: Hepatitis C virus core protein [Synechococcaceae cyanobacterium]|nr:Hepatitis C virus core protein [Synechococcaceae cyanobacterium]
MAEQAKIIRPMVRLQADDTALPLVDTKLDPPLGYRPLAWAGLFANIFVLPLALAFILWNPTWRATNIAVGAGAVLPAAVVGIVASAALLLWRHWGQILAIVALSLSLGVSLPYGIVRLVLEPADRPQLLVLAPVLWLSNLAALIYWCRPVVRQYLR